MKHPQLSTLQDYFENELNLVQSSLVKDHLLDCDHCTTILSQMAKVDTRFKSKEVSPVSEKMKDKIFSDAKMILAAKRKQLEAAQDESKALEEWFHGMGVLIQNTYAEFKAPIFQLASLSVIIGFIVTANKTEQIIIKKPLSEDVVVYSHGEQDSPIEGESR